MHSLSLLRIDYYGIVYCELFAVSVRARLCVVFMCPYCFAIRYDVCCVFQMKTVLAIAFLPGWFFFHTLSLTLSLAHIEIQFNGRAYFFGRCARVLFACLKIVIIQQNYKFSLTTVVFFFSRFGVRFVLVCTFLAYFSLSFS